MFLKQLNILNYRNLREANLDFSPKINCLIGSNGMGKTNVLDAIYFLSFGKSIHTNIDSQNITHGETYFMLKGEYERKEQPELISCGLKSGQKKHLKRNQKEYQRLTDHIGLFPLVIVSPKDSELVAGSSELRRKFIDGVISQTNREFLQYTLAYAQLLRQRNALLKNDDLQYDLLEVIDLQMGQYGTKIYEQRRQFIEQFIPIFQDYYSFIANTSQEIISLDYNSHLSQKDLYDDLVACRERDHIIGFTTHGVHKDDLEMLLNDYPVRQVASQGQQKTFLLALKLAQFEFLKTFHGFCPLLLLDDLFDKLDSLRVARLVELVNSERFGQIFITDTNQAHIDEILQPIEQSSKIFYVENGNVTNQTK